MMRILIIITLLRSSSLAFAQGALNFQNTSTTLISTNSQPSGSVSGVTSGSVGNYFYGLFVAPSGTTNLESFSFTGKYATNLATAGRFRGTDPLPPEGGGVAVPGYPAGGTIAVLIRGWSANVGHDWIEVTSYLANPSYPGWYGESQIATVILGGVVPPTSIFGTFEGNGIKQIPGFTLEMYGVPEPSQTVLIGFGSAVVWLLRRRPH